MGGRSLAEDIKSDTETIMRRALGCSAPCSGTSKGTSKSSEMAAFGIPAGVLTSTLP